MGQATTITVAVVASALLALPLLAGGVIAILGITGIVHPFLAFDILWWIAVTVGGTVAGAVILFVKAFVESLGQSTADQFIAGIAALPLMMRGSRGQSPESRNRSQLDGFPSPPEDEERE